MSLQHDCPYTRFTGALPRVEMLHWCGRENDVLEVKASDPYGSEVDGAVDRLLNDLGAEAARDVRIAEKGRLIVLKHGCSSKKNNVNETIEQHNCVEVQPTIYKDGSEWYRVLAFNNRDLARLFGSLSKWADVEIVSKRTLKDGWKREMLIMSIRALLGRLTDKQIRALTTAINAGYYETPRRIRTLDISRRMKAPRTTYEAHLRKAEGKVMRALSPYIQLVAENERNA